MRRHALRVLVVVLAILPVLALPVAGTVQARVKACSSAHTRPTKGAIQSAQSATLCLLNRQRARNGIRRLRLNRPLTSAATGHSHNMVRRHYFAHGNFVERILNAGYARRNQAWSLGENIAWGADSQATPAKTVRAWMDSPGHRANILNPRFRDIGIGVAVGAPASASRSATYTTDFGRKG